MSTMTAALATRVKPEEKDTFTAACDGIGVSPASALRMFVVAFNKRGGFPFDPANPYGFNKETLQAMDDAANGRNLYGPFKTNEEMWASLLDDEEE